MNWEFILTFIVLLIVVIMVMPLFIVMILAYLKAKLKMYTEVVDKQHTKFHPSSDEFDWSMFEGEIK